VGEVSEVREERWETPRTDETEAQTQAQAQAQTQTQRGRAEQSRAEQSRAGRGGLAGGSKHRVSCVAIPPPRFAWSEHDMDSPVHTVQ
jgi:hypothetical protein